MRNSSCLFRWVSRVAKTDGGSSTRRGFSFLVPLNSRPCLVWVSERVITNSLPPLMSDQRSAMTSPRLAPVAAATSSNVARHQGPVAESISCICSVGNKAVPSCFFGIGGSLFGTGLTPTNPHLTARKNALDTTPAMLRTLFADSGRGVLSQRVRPPLSSSRFHSTEMERRDVRERHRQQFGTEASRLLVVSLAGLWR